MVGKDGNRLTGRKSTDTPTHPGKVYSLSIFHAFFGLRMRNSQAEPVSMRQGRSLVFH